MENYSNDLANFLYKRLAKRMPRKTGEMIRVSLLQNKIVDSVGTKQSSFKIGNTNAETKVPYYHILEDAKRISYQNRSTSQTRGKEVNKPAGERDFSQNRYRRELRFKTEEEKKQYEQDSYENKHFHYIERILGEACREYAHTNKMKLKITRRVK